jgi:hypothetical protein
MRIVTGCSAGVAARAGLAAEPAPARTIALAAVIARTARNAAFLTFFPSPRQEP